MKIFFYFFALAGLLFVSFLRSPVKNIDKISLAQVLAMADGDSEDEYPPPPPPPDWPPPPGQPIPPPDTIPPGTPIIYFDNN